MNSADVTDALPSHTRIHIRARMTQSGVAISQHFEWIVELMARQAPAIEVLRQVLGNAGRLQ